MSASWAGGSTRAWRRVRLYVLERDGWRCQFPGDDDHPAQLSGNRCGRFANHADHILAKSLGGTDHPANLRAACRDHNLAKGDGRRQVVGARRGRQRVRARGWSW